MTDNIDPSSDNTEPRGTFWPAAYHSLMGVGGSGGGTVTPGLRVARCRSRNRPCQR